MGWRFNPALTMQHAWGGLEAGRGEHLGTPPVPGRAADVWTNSELCGGLLRQIGTESRSRAASATPTNAWTGVSADGARHLLKMYTKN